MPFQLTANPKKYAQLLVKNEVLIQSGEKGIKVKKEAECIFLKVRAMRYYAVFLQLVW